MVFNIADHSCVINKSVDQTCMYYIPQFNCAIIGTRSYHSRIEWKLSAPNPVLMSRETLNELPFVRVPYFDKLIITCRDKQSAIRVKRNTLNWSWVTFHDCTSCWGIVAPNSDGLIPRAGGYQVTSTVYSNICDWTFVALEFVRASVRSQSPCKDQSIIWARNNLF